MSRKSLCRFMLSLVVLAGSSCGGDDDDDNEVSSGVPSAQKLGELSTADAKKVCVAYRDSVKASVSEADLKHYSCVFAASIAVSFQAQQGEFDVQKCEMLVDSCVAEVDDAQGSGTLDINCEDTTKFDDWKGCDATVGDFETCATYQVQSLVSLAKSATCEAPPELESDGMQGEEAAVPAQCKALYEKCADVFADMGDDESTVEP